jgi:putative AdoMet-dependent methyltransferase
LSRDDSVSLFDDWAERYDASVAARKADGLWARYDDVLDLVVERAGVACGSRVLDIGCGTGQLTARCAALGAQALGLDPSLSMVERARAKPELAGASFAVVSDPFLCIPCGDAELDCVVSTYAFHHVPYERHGEALAEMLRVLAPAGTVALGDVMFRDPAEHEAAMREFLFLDDEWYGHVDLLADAATGLGAVLSADQLTPYTWVVWMRRC